VVDFVKAQLGRLFNDEGFINDSQTAIVGVKKELFGPLDREEIKPEGLPEPHRRFCLLDISDFFTEIKKIFLAVKQETERTAELSQKHDIREPAASLALNFTTLLQRTAERLGLQMKNNYQLTEEQISKLLKPFFEFMVRNKM